MAKRVSLSNAIEVVTTVAVVVSLIYVAREIQQNTAAVQASSGQAAYEMHQARLSMYMENPELADLEVRMLTDPSSASPRDSVQWRYDLNLRLNLLEMVHANLEAGTMATDMAEGWLALLEEWACLPLADAYWEDARHSYTAAFVRRVDAVRDCG